MYITAGISIAGLLCIAQLSNFKKYRYQFLQGLLLQIVFLCLGIVVMQNVLQSRIQEAGLIAARKDGTVYIMRLTEPLQLKNKTYRLSDGYLDLDLLDERVRKVLGMARVNDVIIR